MKTALLLFVASTAQGATLKELLDAAEKHNFDRRIAQLNRERAEAEYRAAWTGLLPSLTTQAAWTHNQYTAQFPSPQDPTRILTIVAKDQLDATFRFDLPLLDTGRWFRTMAGAALSDAASQRDEAVRDSVKRQVIGTWFEYAGTLAVRESAKRSLDAAVQQAELQEIRAKAGAATELDRLRALAEAERNRQVLTNAENQVLLIRRSLRTLTGMDPGDAAGLPPDDTHPEPPVEELEANVELLPLVRATDREADAQGKLAMAQRLAILPVVGAQFTERVTNAVGFTGQPTSYTAGLGLTWRLDAPTFVNMSVASANEQLASVSTERVRVNARDQIFQDWNRVDSALSRLQAAKSALESRQRAAQVARDRYAAGAATQLDVTDAERDLFAAEVSYIQARSDLVTSRLWLRISAAQPLPIE